MIKTIVTLKRNKNLSMEQFTSHWSTRHVDFVRELPGISRYVQNHIDPQFMPLNLAFDGVGEA